MTVHTTVTDWLLDSDAAIRWQVMRDPASPLFAAVILDFLDKGQPAG